MTCVEQIPQTYAISLLLVLPSLIITLVVKMSTRTSIIFKTLHSTTTSNQLLGLAGNYHLFFLKNEDDI